jgi:hypothetical protein
MSPPLRCLGVYSRCVQRGAHIKHSATGDSRAVADGLCRIGLQWRPPQCGQSLVAPCRCTQVAAAYYLANSKINTLLKAEIARVSRKQVKAEGEALKRASAHSRSDIADLKHRVLQLGRLEAKLAKSSVRVRASADPELATSNLGHRWRPDGFKKNCGPNWNCPPAKWGGL